MRLKLIGSMRIEIAGDEKCCDHRKKKRAKSEHQ